MFTGEWRQWNLTAVANEVLCDCEQFTRIRIVFHDEVGVEILTGHFHEIVCAVSPGLERHQVGYIPRMPPFPLCLT